LREGKADGVEIVGLQEIEEETQRITPKSMGRVRGRFKAEITDAFQYKGLTSKNIVFRLRDRKKIISCPNRLEAFAHWPLSS
jgi:hypothetical protein